MEITNNVVIAYFQDIAEKLLAIGHTPSACHFCSSFEEAEEKAKSGLKYPALIIEEMPGTGRGANNDTNHQERYVQVYILSPAGKGDQATRNTIQTAAEAIQKDILRKIKRDKEDDNNENIASHFNANDYGFEKAGPLIDNLYGYMYEYKIMGNVNLEYDASKWL